jgi:multidrug resistance protein, MATE family
MKGISYKEILSVAFPVMIGSFVQFTVAITDSIFLNRVSSIDFNASGNAGMLYVSLFMLVMGIANGSQVIIARREGEKNYPEAGHIFRQSLLILVVASIMAFALLQVINFFLLDEIVASKPTYEKMNAFIKYRSWGFFFAFITLAYQGFYTGIGKTAVIMYYTTITAVLNILLDYLLIFGHWGFPAMGIEGAALASVISEAAAMVFVIAWTFRSKTVLHYQLFRKIKIHAAAIKEILKLSWPLMLQGFISTGVWTLFFFFIEQMGQDELEISQIIRNFYLIALIPVFGLGAATRTFVSMLIAEKKVEQVIPTVIKIIFLNVLATFLLTHPNLFYPMQAVPFISINESIVPDAALTLQIVTGAMFLLAITSPLLNLLSGAGDTRASFMIEMFAISIYLTGAWLLTIPFPQNITVVWCLEYVYFGTMMLACFWFIRRGKWKKIEV